MVPVPTYDTYLSLTFPSLSVFLSTSSHLSLISQTASTSHSLLVSIKTPSTTSSPWSSTSPNSLPTTSSSSSSVPSPPPLALSPATLWLPLERSLAQIYSVATQRFLRNGKVLATIDVVLEEMREIPICTPMGSNVIKWVYSDYSDSSSTTTPIVGEGGQGSFEVVALGGTFDHLHAGHKILLTMASSLATRKVIVGVSDDELLGKKQYREWLEGIKERIEQVERFLELVRPGVKHEVVPLKDVYGPTATDPDIQALVVSEETRSGGDAINKLRSERSLSTLETFVINLVSDDGSTTSTVDGVVDEKGKGGGGKETQVKVAVETKMGSTGIREWISRQEAGKRRHRSGDS